MNENLHDSNTQLIASIGHDRLIAAVAVGLAVLYDTLLWTVDQTTGGIEPRPMRWLMAAAIVITLGAVESVWHVRRARWIDRRHQARAEALIVEIRTALVEVRGQGSPAQNGAVHRIPTR